MTNYTKHRIETTESGHWTSQGAPRRLLRRGAAFTLRSFRQSVGTFFVDESGNPHHPHGREVLAVTGIFAAAGRERPLRNHVEKARRRASEPVQELRFRAADARSRRFFFDEARLETLDVHVVGLATDIRDMAALRRKIHPARLYEFLLSELVRLACCTLPLRPEIIHFDPSSGFASRREFAQRIERDLPTTRVVFAPDSVREKGLQAADMAAGALRRYVLGRGSDEWLALVEACRGRCVTLSEPEIRRTLGK